MRTELCERLGIEVPIFAFTHCRDVVVEVSRAGGLGVLGAAGFRPEQLEKELQWIDDHVDGKPYGVDVIMPIEYVDADPKALANMIPDGHRPGRRDGERGTLGSRRDVRDDLGMCRHARASALAP